MEKEALRNCIGFSYLNIKQNRRKAKSISGDKEGHFEMLRNSVEQEDMLMLNLYYSITSQIY